MMRAITILTASHIAIVAKDAKSRWKTVLSQPFNHGRASAYLHRVFPAAAIDVVYGKKFKSIFATALAFAAVMIDDFLPSLFGPKSRGMPRGFPCLIVQGCPTGRAFLFFQHLSTLLMKFHVGAPWDRKWLVAVRAVFGLARYKSHCLSKQETPSDWRHCCLGSTLVVFGGHVIEKRKAALLGGALPRQLNYSRFEGRILAFQRLIEQRALFVSGVKPDRCSQFHTHRIAQNFHTVNMLKRKEYPASSPR